MNCMKYHNKRERSSPEARKLIKEAFTKLQADAIVNGWDKALSNLREETNALHADNYISEDLMETQEDGAFVNETLEDELCCPYCMGQSETPILDNNVGTYKCKSCGRTYEIEYSMSSVGMLEPNIIDIKNNDGESLFIGGNI